MVKYLSCAVLVFLCCTVLGIQLNIDFAGKVPTGHIQGADFNGQHLYIAFTANLFKCDMTGKILKKTGFPKIDGIAGNDIKSQQLRMQNNITRPHFGDLCFADGKIFVAFSGSGFNRELNGGNSYNYIFEYDTDLNLLKRHHVPIMQYGVGGITFANGSFYVVGGRPDGVTGNTVYVFDRSFKAVSTRELPFNSFKGIQTISYNNGKFFIGCYGWRELSWVLNENFQIVSVHNLDFSKGIIHQADGKQSYCFDEHKNKDKKTTKVSAFPVNLEKFKVKTLELNITEDGKFITDNKSVSKEKLCLLFKEMRRKNGIVFINIPSSVPGKAVADAVLLAQQNKLDFHVLVKKNDI